MGKDVVIDASYERILPANAPEEITLHEFFDEQYYPFAKVTKRRPELDKFIFDKHIRNQIGGLLLSEISPAIMDRWVMTLVGTNNKASTINKHIFLLNRLLNLAEGWGYLDENKFKNRRIKQLKVGEQPQRFLHEREIKMLITACEQDAHPHIAYFVQLLILTGARKGEARLMKWGYVDQQHGVWVVPLSKNGKKRLITLSKSALKVLSETKTLNISLNLSTNDDDYVFVNPKTRFSYQSFYAAWHRIRHKVGLDSVRIHDLRHTYASLLINNGASIYEVQKLLGHHHISMTERYAHLLPNTLHQRVEMLSGLIE